jgi:hypothetical protein
MSTLPEDELCFEPSEADLLWWAEDRDRDAAWEALRVDEDRAREAEYEDRTSGLYGLLRQHVSDAIINASVIGHKP